MLNYFTFPIIVLLPQKPAFEAKGRQYTTDNVIQRLFNIVL